MRRAANELTSVTKPTTSEIVRCDDCDDERLPMAPEAAAANANE